MKPGYRTFDDVMVERKGHTTGFDYVRIALAVGVTIHHATIVSADHLDFFRTIWRVPLEVVLPAFFALSGFLVSGSLLRNSVPQFVALRVMRIFPALAVEVILCALILGPLFTTLPLGGYFGHPMFHRYLLNMFGVIHFFLPGVFGGAPINPQLWTIPVELECYVALVVIALLGLIRRRWVLLVLVAGGCAVMTAIALRHGLIADNHPLTGRVLVTSYLAGALVFYFRDRLPFNAALFCVSLALAAVFIYFQPLAYLSGPPIAYATAYVGLQRFRPIPFGDLSYGVYLFHYPIAQTIVHVFAPNLHWYELLALMLVVTSLFAAASWLLVEQPLLRRKHVVLAWIDRMIPPRVHRLPSLNPTESWERGDLTEPRRSPALQQGSALETT
jgi:peptidoglycan/LPS O-acetylase OafA/YrhL